MSNEINLYREQKIVSTSPNRTDLNDLQTALQTAFPRTMVSAIVTEQASASLEKFLLPKDPLIIITLNGGYFQ